MIDDVAPAHGVPVRVVHAEAVQQQQDLARGAWHRRQAVGVEGGAAVSKAHRGRERAVARHEVIAHHAVERRQHGVALR